MKKSEALQGIFQLLQKADKSFQYSTAHEILSYLESKGMLPPAYKVEEEYSPDMKFNTMTYYVEGLPEWREENV